LFLKFNDHAIRFLVFLDLFEEAHVHVFREHGLVLHFFFFLNKHF
jgi:hypothetical protein